MDRKILIYKSVDRTVLSPLISTHNISRFVFFFAILRSPLAIKEKTRMVSLSFRKSRRKKKRSKRIYIYNIYTRYCNYCCTEYCSTVVRIILILKKDLFDSLVIRIPLRIPSASLLYFAPCCCNGDPINS